MNLSKQKLALTGFAAAAVCVILGRWGLWSGAIRERDVLMVFVGGLLCGLALVRFFKQWRATPDAPAPAAAPPAPSVPPAPKTKS